MKSRLDVLLVSKGYFQSREKAKASIMAGEVMVDGLVFDKPGMSVDEEAEIIVKSDSCPYVSRGGLKLEKAITEFNIDLTKRICLDIGASTGGFTDCMLKNGARKVYAFDVGYGQLDYRLREDDRVVNLERCNFRYFENKDKDGNIIVDSDCSFASIDVSFISLKHIFPVCSGLLSQRFSLDKKQVVSLVKPQFEAGREQVGKNGIVREPEIHIEVINNVIDYAKLSNLYPVNLSFSPITGAKGNIEYLLLLEVLNPNDINKETNIGYNIKVEDIVYNAHSSLK